MTHVTQLACRCGCVRLEVDGDPIITAECHCDSCRSAALRLETLADARPLLEPNGGTRFVLYAFVTAPNASTAREIALLSIGQTAMPMPLSEASPKLKRTWNNLGHPGLLGAPDFPSSPAPSTVLNKPSGLGRIGTFTFQGLILDPLSPGGVAAVTNGIVLQVH